MSTDSFRVNDRETQANPHQREVIPKIGPVDKLAKHGCCETNTGNLNYP